MHITDVVIKKKTFKIMNPKKLFQISTHALSVVLLSLNAIYFNIYNQRFNKQQ